MRLVQSRSLPEDKAAPPKTIARPEAPLFGQVYARVAVENGRRFFVFELSANESLVLYQEHFLSLQSEPPSEPLPGHRKSAIMNFAFNDFMVLVILHSGEEPSQIEELTQALTGDRSVVIAKQLATELTPRDSQPPTIDLSDRVIRVIASEIRVTMPGHPQF